MTDRFLSIVIPNYNGARYLGPCLDSIRAQDDLEGRRLEILVVDNASSDGTATLLRDRYPEVVLIANSENTGFTRAVNQGVAASRGDLVLLLNNDTLLTPESLGLLAARLDESPADVGGVQPLLVQVADRSRVDSAGIALGPRLRPRDDLAGRPVDEAPKDVTEIWGACAACALLRRETLERCGGLDPDFFAEFDDVDFAFRARWHGYSFLLVPRAIVLHHRSATQGISTARFIRRSRNAILVLMKDPPAGLSARLLLYRFQRDLLTIPHSLRRRRFQAVARAWSEALRLWPRMRERRRELLAGARLTPAEMTAQLRRFTTARPVS